MKKEQIVKETYKYLKEVESIANELNKFVRKFNLSILDLTSDLRVLSASLLISSISSIYRYNMYGKQLSSQTNLCYFKDSELILDTILAFDRSIGIICIDAKTPENVYFGVESAIAIIQPPIMILGSSEYDTSIALDYSNMYNFKVVIKGNSQELGKVYYNAKSNRRK